MNTLKYYVNAGLKTAPFRRSFTVCFISSSAKRRRLQLYQERKNVQYFHVKEETWQSKVLSVQTFRKKAQNRIKQTQNTALLQGQTDAGSQTLQVNTSTVMHVWKLLIYL